MVSSVRIGDSPFTQQPPIYGESLGQVRPDHNSKMATGTGEELKMVSTFSIRKFRLEILDYLSRRSVYFGNFPVGRVKIALPFTF